MKYGEYIEAPSYMSDINESLKKLADQNVEIDETNPAEIKIKGLY